MTPEEVARRFASRPGMKLATYREVGLPLWEMSVRCLTLAHRDLPPLQEFVLRAIDAGLTTATGVTGMLGLADNHVVATLADLVTSDYLAPLQDSENVETSFGLTVAGRRAAQELEELAPEQRVYSPLHYDGLTRRFVRLGNVALYTKAQLMSDGIEEVPAFPNDPPDVSGLSLANLASIFGELASPTEVRRDLLALLSIEGLRRRLFQKAVALIFEGTQDGEVSVAFAIDGRLSEEHASAFAAAEGLRKLGILKTLRRTGEAVAGELLPREVIEAQAEPAHVQALRSTSDGLRDAAGTLRAKIETALPGPESEALEQQLVETSERLAAAEAALDALPVRALEVFEHANLLRNAFDEATSRLLIVSPWIRAAVVNAEFLDRLRSALDRGVEVMIGYGVGVDTAAARRDVEAEDALRNLSRSYANLVLGRLGDSHAKVLIVDNKFAVVTSFNWLSFKGDAQMPFRDERGILVSLPDTVDGLFNSLALRVRAAADAATVV